MTCYKYGFHWDWPASLRLAVAYYDLPGKYVTAFTSESTLHHCIVAVNLTVTVHHDSGLASNAFLRLAARAEPELVD